MAGAYEYAIKSADVHGNWTVEHHRYDNSQKLANAFEDRRAALADQTVDPTTIYRPLVRMAAGEWIELASDPRTLNALRAEVHEHGPQSHMILAISEYEELVSAAMAALHDLHPVYASTSTWHEGMGAATPTKGCSIADTPPWAGPLLEITTKIINEHAKMARKQGLQIDVLQSDHPEARRKK